jgi:stage II sporulation SpoAA-like protein
LTQNPSGGAKPRLDYDLEKASGILTIEPKALLTVDDFKALTANVDRYLASHDTLTGILLGVAHVPGWENFAAFIQHMRFVRDHQKRIARVAVSPIIRS